MNQIEFRAYNLVSVGLVIIMFLLPSANYQNSVINLLINFFGILGLIAFIYLIIVFAVFLWMVITPIIIFYIQNPALFIYQISKGRIKTSSDPYDLVMKKWFDVYGGGYLTEDSTKSNIKGKVAQDEQQKRITELAKLCVMDFWGMDLDFSPESLESIDKIIQSSTTKLLAIKSNRVKGPSQLVRIMSELCAYVIEVVRINNDGKVVPNSLLWDSVFVLDDEKQISLFPGAWVIKCFAYGKTDLVSVKYAAINQIREERFDG